MAYESTRDSARHLQADAQSDVQDVRGDVRTFISAAIERVGLVGEDAKRLGNDLSSYLQHWSQLVREDASEQAKAAGINLGMLVGAGFVAAVGFLLLNMGIVWTLSATDTGVGPWFIIFGAGWLIVGAVLGLVGYVAGKKAVRGTVNRVKSDVKIPQQHARSVTHTLQEQRNEPPTAH